jgi:hypothetical protein
MAISLAFIAIWAVPFGVTALSCTSYSTGLLRDTSAIDFGLMDCDKNSAYIASTMHDPDAPSRRVLAGLTAARPVTVLLDRCALPIRFYGF